MTGRLEPPKPPQAGTPAGSDNPMLAAAGHGIAYAKGRAELARALAVVSLVGSPGGVLLATGLPVT